MGVLYGLTIILFLLLIVEILGIALKITGLDNIKTLILEQITENIGT